MGYGTRDLCLGDYEPGSQLENALTRVIHHLELNQGHPSHARQVQVDETSDVESIPLG